MDLTPFCETGLCGSVRYKMDRPFVREAWTYATDARIAVRVEGLTDCGDEDGRLPPMHTLQFEHDAMWRPWPALAFSAATCARNAAARERLITLRI